jgi:hypothetical protein
MSRDAAKIIVEVVTKNAAKQDAVLAKIQSLCTEDEFREDRRMIGRSMGAIFSKS